jgi:hypothetical protein
MVVKRTAFTVTELSDELEMAVTLALPERRASDELTLGEIARVEAFVATIFAKARAPFATGSTC